MPSPRGQPARICQVASNISNTMIDTHRVMAHLLSDAIPTLGERARAEVLRLAAHYESLAQEWLRNGSSPIDAQRDVESAIVDGLQETAHDLFWDTTWPACPRHRNHPLWYNAVREAWCCEEDGSVFVPLGKLAEPRSPAP